jgi:osmotically-inducible protein OsmY
MKRQLCVLVLAATLSAFGQKEPPRDAVVRDQVSMKLTMDRDVRGGGLQIEVKDGVVTMKGLVKDAKAKEKATKLAKKIKGVKSVDNQLTLPDPNQR